MHFNCTNQVHTHIVQMALAESWKMLKPASSQMQIRFQRKYSLKRVLSAKYDWKWKYTSETNQKYKLAQMWVKANQQILLFLPFEQIQLAKMASSWNEDWDEIRKHSCRKYNIILWTNPTCENGLQLKWGLGGWHVWSSSSATVTLWEFFLADILSWDMYEVNLPQYVNAVVQFFSRISHCFPISHFLGYWKQLFVIVLSFVKYWVILQF